MGIARYPALDVREHYLHFKLEFRSLGYLAVAVAALCATCVFFLLCQRDNSRFLAVSNPTKTIKVTQQTQLALARPQSTDEHASQPAPAPAPQRLDFRLHRSRSFQTVGPVKLRLLRINVRRSNADLSLMVNGRRTDRTHVGLDKPLQIGGGKGSGKPIAIVLSSLTKESVSGYLTASSAP
jgi:hypothetical protein